MNIPMTLQDEVADQLHHFYQQFAAQSGTKFLIAQGNQSKDLIEVAGQVLCLLNDKYVSVSAIEQICSQHDTIAQGYEAWLLTRRDRIISVAAKLLSHERDALLLYAGSFHTLNLSNAVPLRAEVVLKDQSSLLPTYSCNAVKPTTFSRNLCPQYN